MARGRVSLAVLGRSWCPSFLSVGNPDRAKEEKEGWEGLEVGWGGERRSGNENEHRGTLLDLDASSYFLRAVTNKVLLKKCIKLFLNATGTAATDGPCTEPATAAAAGSAGSVGMDP